MNGKRTVLSVVSRYTPYIITLLLAVAMSFASSSFLTFSNIISVLRQSSFLLVMSMGMMFAMVLGRGVDMSVGATVAMSSCLAAPFLKASKGPATIVLGFIIALSIGLIIGIINGTLIAYLKMPAMLVTYGMTNILRGIIYSIMEGSVVMNLSKPVVWMGSGYVGKIPAPIIIAGIVCAIASFVFKCTPLGRKLLIVGENPEAARFSGINSNRITVMGFALSGLCAALAGIMYIGRLGTAEATIGADFHLNAIAAAAIGGVSFNGGVANPVGVIAGAIIIFLLTNAMNLLNISSSWQGLLNGAIILLAVLLDYFNNRTKA
ncbi:MAG: ABC transporter permease [Clostridia bacterium]|nr:ABC transporter permease [Clostridia bacterium]